MSRASWLRALAVLALAGAAGGASAQQVARVTIVEGSASLVRGAVRHAVAEGIAVQRGDIVETATPAFVRLESADGAIADLGPSTRLFVAPPGRRARAGVGDAYLLAGWVKLIAPAAAGGVGPGLWSGMFELRELAGSVVVRVAADAAGEFAVGAFVESGSARFADRLGAAAGPALAATAGEFYGRTAAAAGGGKGGVAPRPPAKFMAAVPLQFRDALPARAAKFTGKPPAPRRIGDVAYAEVADWLSADVSLRVALLPRWRARAADPAFRAGLVQNLRAHPEWDPILYPEKYRPVAPPPAAAAAAAAPAAAR